jgi:hypothetical protein
VYIDIDREAPCAARRAQPQIAFKCLGGGRTYVKKRSDEKRNYFGYCMFVFTFGARARVVGLFLSNPTL